MHEIYSLIGVLEDNTRGRFTSCVGFKFQAPQGQGKMRAMSKMSACIIDLKHRIRDVSFHCICFRLVLLQQKLVKPGFYSVIRWQILCVLLPLYGKMTQQWNNRNIYQLFQALKYDRFATFRPFFP